MTPFVFVAYSSAHFPISQGASGDPGLERLLAMATKAAARYFHPLPNDLQTHPRAFWLAHTCMPPEEFADENGQEFRINVTTPEGAARRDEQVNQDVCLPRPTSLPSVLLVTDNQIRRCRRTASATSSALRSTSSSSQATLHEAGTMTL